MSKSQNQKATVKKKFDSSFDSHRYKKISKRLKTTKTIMAIIILGTLFISLYFTLITHKSYSKSWSINRTKKEVLNYNILADGVLEYNREGLRYYSKSNNLVYSKAFSFTEPKFFYSGDSGCIVDSQSKTVIPLNKSKIKSNIKLDREPMLIENISEDKIALISRNNKDYFFEIINDKGDKILDVKSTLTTGGIPVSFSLNKTKNRLAMVYLKTDGKAINSNVIVYDVSKSSTEPNEKIVFNKLYNDEIIGDIKFSSERIIYYSEKQIYSFDLKRQKLDTYTLKDSVRNINITKDKIILMREGVKSLECILLNKKLDEIVSQKIHENVNKISIHKDNIIFIDGNIATGYDMNFNKIFSFKFNDTIEDMAKVGYNEYIVIDKSEIQKISIGIR